MSFLMVSGSSLGLCCLLRLGLVGPGADDGMTINGILYVLTTGCRWMDMPIRYGSYKTAWSRNPALKYKLGFFFAGQPENNG